jgi:hypothetical protein
VAVSSYGVSILIDPDLLIYRISAQSALLIPGEEERITWTSNTDCDGVAHNEDHPKQRVKSNTALPPIAPQQSRAAPGPNKVVGSYSLVDTNGPVATTTVFRWNFYRTNFFR